MIIDGTHYCTHLEVGGFGWNLVINIFKVPPKRTHPTTSTHALTLLITLTLKSDLVFSGWTTLDNTLLQKM